jgi:hypothetical protein
MHSGVRSAQGRAGVLLLVLVVWLAASCGSAASSGSPAQASGSTIPALPGTPGHFENGTFSFDYPATWKALSGEYTEGFASLVYAVLGTGSWHSGCHFTSNGGSCTGDVVDVSAGRVVVKLWSRAGGPMAYCSDTPANATLGPNAVMESSQDGIVVWEVRRPGSSWNVEYNVFVQVWADGGDALAGAKSIVASYHWDAGVGAGGSCMPTPEPSVV